MRLFKVLLRRHNRNRLQLRSTPSFVDFVPFQRNNEKEGRPVMVKRKLGGAGDESSLDQKIRKSDATVHVT